MKSLSLYIFLKDVLTLLLLIVIDLVSKYLFFNQRIWAESFFLEPAMNTGISFSMDMSLEIVIVMTIVALLLFGYMYVRELFPKIAIILLLWWTLGNLYDRVVYDGVRDFIVVPDWFICNVADIFLFVGMVWACYYLLMDHKKK